MAMYIIREEIATSLPAIGQAFGNRDHTTVLHSCDKIRDCLREDPDVRRDMDALRQQIFAGAPV
jgi:chromosomal replication initiator protein